MITDEVLLALVPAAMTKAQGGPEAWAEARQELIDAFGDHERAKEHYRACVIAHYVGFLSAADEGEQRRWHEAALEHAGLADTDEVAGFMPSLLASVGAAAAAHGDAAAALGWYERAASHLHALKDDEYGTKLRRQILERLDSLRMRA